MLADMWRLLTRHVVCTSTLGFHKHRKSKCKLFALARCTCVFSTKTDFTRASQFMRIILRPKVCPSRKLYGVGPYPGPIYLIYLVAQEESGVGDLVGVCVGGNDFSKDIWLDLLS